MTEIKKRILSNVMCLILGAGIGAGGYALKERITEPELPGIELEAPKENGGALLGESTEQGVKLISQELTREEYAEYGVTALAENAYTLTATITPSDAENQEVDWRVEFVDSSSSWASGKSVTDYVTVTPTSDGALTATVANLGEFGEQIKVTVTSRDNPEAKAECTVDYVQKIIEPYLTIGDIEFVNDGVTEVDFEVEAGETGPGGVIDFGVRLSEVYTIEAEIPSISLDIYYTFFFESMGENIDFHLVTSSGDGYSLYFDRTLFMDDPDNGRESFMSGEAVSEEQINEWDSLDIIRMIMLMPENGPMYFEFSFYTEQSGTVTFSSELRLNIEESVNGVQDVTLDEDTIKF